MADGAQFILFFPGDLIFFSDVFSGNTHVIAIKYFKKAVKDHQVYQVRVVHSRSPPGRGQGVGDHAHVFHAARQHHIGCAGGDGLSGQGNGFHSRGTDLVNGKGAGFLRNTGLYHGLPCHILSLAGTDNISHDNLIHLDGLQGVIVIIGLFFKRDHPRAFQGVRVERSEFLRNNRLQSCLFQGLFQNNGAKLHYGCCFQGPTKGTDGCSDT